MDVIFTDEKTFSNHRCFPKRVRRVKGSPPTIVSNKWTARKSINVYGAMSHEGLIFLKWVPGTLNATGYAEVLDEAITEAKKKYPKFTWMQDNASIHRPQCVEEVYEKQKVEKLKAPARSPDLNPIENVWSQLVKHLDNFIDKEGEATTETVLFERVLKASKLLQKRYFIKLYQSMPNRMNCVIHNEGKTTKY